MFIIRLNYSLGTGDVSCGVERLQRDVDHWHPFSAEVKNE